MAYTFEGPSYPLPPRARRGAEFDAWCLALLERGYATGYVARLADAPERAVRFAAERARRRRDKEERDHDHR